MLCSKKVDELPLLHETLPAHPGRDEVILDEMWGFVGSKAQPVWPGAFWAALALSRHHLQILAFHLGPRNGQSARQLWEQVPAPWKRDLVFTDGFNAYPPVFQERPLQHCRCFKSGSLALPEEFGETAVLEGVNNALRQGVSYLGRKSLAFARSLHWLRYRLTWFIHQWNKRQAKKYQ